jgi:3-isopropylmalate/(R)-2-methylmalate dehydratase small subunit
MMSQHAVWQPVLTGKAWVLGDLIDTDLLAPGAYMKKPVEELAQHCLEAINPAFAKSVQAGDIVIAGRGFGIGSSREQAALALKILGVGCVLAQSFARIFYRNALNLGLPVLVCDTAQFAQVGDNILVNLQTSTAHNLNRDIVRPCEPMPAFLQAMLADGGLLPHLKKRHQQSNAGR